MKLHEIELFSDDPKTSAELFSSVLGLKVNVDEPTLKVFDAGVNGVDLNISNHYTSNKISFSFLVNDIHAFVKSMHNKNIEVSEVYDSHLGMKGVILADNSLCRIVVHGVTEASPEWMHKMV